MTNIVDHLVSKFGSQGALAKAAGRDQSSVAGWKKNNRIPSKAQISLLEHAKKQGIELSPMDMIPVQEPAA